MTARTAADLLDRWKMLVPWWLRPDPFGAGLSAVMEDAERVGWALGDAAMPSTSTGAWLRLLARGLGLDVSPSEGDDEIRARIKAWPKRTTREDVHAAATALLDPLMVGWQLVEFHEAQLYLDETATEFCTDLFCDERNMLVVAKTYYLYVEDGLLTTAQELSLVQALAFTRAAGVRVVIVFDTDYGTLVRGDHPWSEA